MNPLDKWLTTNNFYSSSKERETFNYLLLDSYKGGKLFIPIDKEYKFWCLYSDEMKNGTKLYVVEQRDKVFKYMLDLDISDSHYWSVEEISELTKFIQKIIKEFFGDDHSTVCCTSPQKIKHNKIHTGIHLIWNDLYVTSDTAMVIRDGLVQRLNKQKEIVVEKPWKDIIDELVYTRVGYRMVGSDKFNKDEKVPENRELNLLFVMNTDGILRKTHYERLLNSPKDLILETSIRNVIDTYKEIGMKIVFPKWLEVDCSNIAKTFGTSHNYSILSNKEHILIENFIRKNLPKCYSRAFIKSISKYPDGNLLITTTSKYCMNIKRDHNSCGIYFFGCSDGIYQKCFCPCETLNGRIKGYCKDFTSECFKFPDDIRLALFPKSKKKKKNVNMFVPETYDSTKKEYSKVCDKLFAGC
jgi:hypothetical protein